MLFHKKKNASSIEMGINIGDVVLIRGIRWVVVSITNPSNGLIRYGCAKSDDTRLFFREDLQKTGEHIDNIKIGMREL